jgi:hypothetical protein
VSGVGMTEVRDDERDPLVSDRSGGWRGPTLGRIWLGQDEAKRGQAIEIRGLV